MSVAVAGAKPGMSANRFEKKMKKASVPMSGRKRRAFCSPMTPLATLMTASVNISNRLRSVSLPGGTIASRPPPAVDARKASAPMLTKMSTQNTASTCVSENADGNISTPRFERPR